MRKHSGGSGCKTNCKGDSTVNFKFEHKILVFFLFRRLQLVDWNLFWTALGAIGGTLGAIATFVAVVVALWQTKLNYKKKIQLSFTDNITVMSESGGASYRYIGVTITNIGNRDIVIQNWGFELDDGSQMLIVPDTSPIGRMLQVKLPHRLQIEEGITLYYEKNLFRNAILDGIEKGKMKENKKIRFYVSDSTAKKHYVLTNKVATDLLKDTTSKKKAN